MPSPTDYPPPKACSGSFYGVTQHTVDAVLTANNLPALLPPLGMSVPKGIDTAVGVFVGYLLFDAWIGNTDRHHENWGWIQIDDSSTLGSSPLCLAPTYDHASSMGRELTDQKREQHLRGPNSAASMATYVDRCRSALYGKEEDEKTVAPIEAFRLAARKFPVYATIWVEQLDGVADRDFAEVFEAMPETYITPDAAEFAQKLLQTNRRRILELAKEIP